MGLLGRLFNTFKNDVVNPVQRVANPQPRPMINAAQLQQALQGAKYGVLANNPQAQQQFVQSVAPTHFNPITSIPSALSQTALRVDNTLGGIAQGTGHAVVNTAKLPFQAAEYLGAQAASPELAKPYFQKLQNSYNQSIPGGMINEAVTGGNKLLGGQQAKFLEGQVNNTHAQLLKNGVPGNVADDWKNQALNYGYNTILNNAKVGINESGKSIFAKAAANFGQNALNVASLGATGSAATAPTVAKSLSQAVAQGFPVAGYQGASSVLGSIEQGQYKPSELLKSGIQGLLQGELMGAAVPVAKAAIKGFENRVPVSNDVGAVGRDVNGKLPKRGAPNPLADLTDAQLAERNYVHNLQASQGEGAQLANVPRTEATSADFQATKAAAMANKAARGGGPNPTSKDVAQYSDTFGVTKETAMQDLAKLKAQDEAITSRAVSKPTEPLNNGIKEQLNPSKAPKRLAEENTALNPKKANIPEVQPGNWDQARINPQLASKPVQTLADTGAMLARKLSPEEKANFGQMVEGTITPKSKAAIQAVDMYHQMADQAHAVSQALGGNTNYKQSYFHRKWDLSKPEDAAKYNSFLEKNGGYVDPYDFRGINSQPQAFKTVAEGEKAGFHLVNKGDPAKDFTDYGKSAGYSLRQQALRKSVAEADAINPNKNATLVMGGGEAIPISKEGLSQIKGYQHTEPSTNQAVQAYRATNKAAKQTILGISEFHPANVGGLRAAPAMAAKGHPLNAIKAVYGMVRAQIDPTFNDNLRIQAAKDGLVEDASRIGMPYGSSDFTTTGAKAISGNGLIFGKAMPAVHDQMVRSVVADLNKKGIPLDSVEAHQAGLVGNKLMGFVNSEVQNLDPRVQRGLSDVAFAPQFTRSGMQLFKDAVKPGVAGSYARRGIVANVAATTALIGGLGSALNQQSDSVKDTVLRAVFDPAVPTPLKDAKGNNIQLRTPATYTSNVAKLLGMKLVRNSDGHLGVSWNPSNLPTTVSDYLRTRLAVVPSNIFKIATNTSFAGKPLYDPNAPLGQKVQQGATTVGTGLLPIGLQGLPYTNAVKSHLPQNVQDVLNAGQPGTNPLLKSFGSSFGLTPTTDKTVGKGLVTSQHFDNQKKFVDSLDTNGRSLFNTINPEKKNPVTGELVYDPTIFQKAGTYGTLRDNPDFTSKYQAYQQSQANHDPLWDLPSKQLQEVITLRSGKSLPGQTYTKAGASLSQATETDQQWYKNLLANEQVYYSSLPTSKTPGAKADYGPQPSPYVSTQLNNKNFKDPQVQQYLNDRATYTNSQRSAQGGLLPISQFGQVGVPGQLDNPAQLAITPKGSSYGTGAPKAKTSAGTTTPKVSTAKAKKIKVGSLPRIRTAKASSIKKIKTSTPRYASLRFTKPKKVKVATA